MPDGPAPGGPVIARSRFHNIIDVDRYAALIYMDAFTSGYTYACRKLCAARLWRVHICPKMIPPADVDIGRARIRGQIAPQNHDQHGRPNYKNQRNEQTDPIPGNPKEAIIVQRNLATNPSASRYETTIDSAFSAIGVGCAWRAVAGPPRQGSASGRSYGIKYLTKRSSFDMNNMYRFPAGRGICLPKE